jgi:hypothetical protein
MDPGWHDLVAVLFGYWHFEEAVLVVEDELAEAKLNSSKIAAQLKAKEAALWPPDKVQRIGTDGLPKAQPFRRYTDRDPRLVADLRAEHGLQFSLAKKDTPEQAVNQLRVAIADKRIWIHPRCVKLQAHLKSAIWKNELHRTFSWQGGVFGHFDLVAALVYFWRNVQRSRNPAPQHPLAITSDQHFIAPREERQASPWTRDRQPSAWSKQVPEPRAKWARENGRIVRVR